METDPRAVQGMRQQARRQRGGGSWLPLLSAIMQLARGQAELISHAERSWASATFTGSRHQVKLRFAGSAGSEAAEHFITTLSEHEFTLPGQLVADATVIGVVQQMLPDVAIELEAELLLLDDV